MGTSSSSALWACLQPGGNPLVRHSDRHQARVAALLLALVLVATPIVAVFGFVYHAGLAERAQTQYQQRSQVTATLLEGTSAVRTDMDGVRIPRRAVALAEWSTQDGMTHTGQIPVAANAHKGDTLSIWIDRDGAQVRPPMTSSETMVVAALAAMGIWLAVALTLAGIYRLVCARLDRARYAEWDRQWQELDKHHT